MRNSNEALLDDEEEARSGSCTSLDVGSDSATSVRSTGDRISARPTWRLLTRTGGHPPGSSSLRANLSPNRNKGFLYGYGSAMCRRFAMFHVDDNLDRCQEADSAGLVESGSALTGGDARRR